MTNHQVPADDELDLRKYWHILRRRWRLVLAIFASVVAIGVFWVLTQVPLYLGEVTLLVEGSKTTQLSALGAGLGEAVSPVETEMELIKSRTIAEYVVRELGLDARLIDGPPMGRVRLTEFKSTQFESDKAHFFTVRVKDDRTYDVFHQERKLGTGILGETFAGDGVSWVLEFSGLNPGTYHLKKIPFNAAVNALRSSMNVAPVGKGTNIIGVSVEDSNPAMARDIANKISDAYLAQNVWHKGQEATQTLQFIETQLDSIRTNLEQSEQEIDQFKSEKGIFVLSETAQKLISQISNLELSRTELELQLQQFDYLLKTLTSKDLDSAFILGNASVSDPLVSSLIANLSQRLIELRGLREDFTDDNPRLQLIIAQVDEIKEKIRSALENAKSTVSHRKKSIENILGSYEQQLRLLPQTERALAGLARKSEVSAELYTFLLKKHEEMRIARAGIVGNVRVVDAAILPEHPFFPRVNRVAVFVLAIGLMFGVLGAILLEYLDDSIKGVTDIERLGLTTYGIIPFTVHDISSPLYLQNVDPRGAVQEAFRSLRTNVTFLSTDKPIKTILCTSPLPGAGKTTINSNLAFTLAQGGSRVLLVDVDFRRPQVHLFMEKSLEPGLTNALLGGASWRQMVHVSNSLKNLSVLTAGAIPPNPAEIIGMQWFRDFVNEAAAEFDYVVFDCPPVLAFTDAVILSSYVDAVFLVFEAGRTTMPTIDRALASLANVNAKVRGVVLNKMKQTSVSEGYYYSYGDYYEKQRPKSFMNRVLDFFS